MVLQTKQWIRIREDKGRLPKEPLRAQKTKASVVVAGEASFLSIAWSLSRTRVHLMGASVNGKIIYRPFCKPSRPTDQIHLKTIFNRVTECKPFVVEHVEMVEHESQSLIEMSVTALAVGDLEILTKCEVYELSEKAADPEVKAECPDGTLPEPPYAASFNRGI